MKEIKHRHKQDVIDLMKEALDQGIETTSDEIIEAVDEFSDSIAAGWCVPHIWYIIWYKNGKNRDI